MAVQGAIAVALAAGFLALGRTFAVASMIAGVVVIAPNAWFAWRILASDTGGEAAGAARRIVGNGVAKVLLTTGLLIVAFAWFRPQPVAFFATMFGLQLAYWLAPLLERH